MLVLLFFNIFIQILRLLDFIFLKEIPYLTSRSFSFFVKPLSGADIISKEAAIFSGIGIATLS
jgi:hypothetical protein